MNKALIPVAIRVLRAEEVARSNKNKLIRENFGDRITKALASECAFRDTEIDAINATIALLEKRS